MEVPKKTIILGVTSSISIYKACEIIREFQKEDLDVHVVMTKNASRLISPRLFSSLSGNEVLLDLFDEAGSPSISHITLTQGADLLLVAPATANIIGKFASGVADDALSTVYTAADCPVVVAPAMNEKMYLHRSTYKNIQRLKSDGIKFIEPDKGYLACGDEGLGRLASPCEIVKKCLEFMNKATSLNHKCVLVTAGPTREFFDPVRFISSRSSGKMGFELAEEALRRGAEVILVSGPSQIPPPPGIKLIKVQTAKEMNTEVMKFFDQADIVVMAAAVSDFTFNTKAKQKIKKQELSTNIKLVRTQDILAELGRKKENKILIGFAAETGDLKKNALEKIKEKNLDFIVANDVSKMDIGFDSEENKVCIYYKSGKSVITDKKSKLVISQIIMDEIEDIIGEKSG